MTGRLGVGTGGGGKVEDGCEDCREAKDASWRTQVQGASGRVKQGSLGEVVYPAEHDHDEVIQGMARRPGAAS